jgi:LPS export ABC transporter protein LptC
VNRPRHITLVLLLALAAGSWWLAGNHGTAPSADPAGPAGSPGYYLNDATLEQTDLSGRTTLVAHATRALQQDAGSSIALEAPTVRYRTDSGRMWLMTAQRGLLPQGRSLVELDGDVALRAEGAGGAVVHTEHLELDVPAQVASTAEPVRIELPPHALLAGGLHADLTKETLRLEGVVHGTFSR